MDELRAYLAYNYDVFKHALDKIEGVVMMLMQSTYLARCSCRHGMDRETFTYHVYGKARIAATPGHTLGQGGASFLRFNLGTQRARVEDASSVSQRPSRALMRRFPIRAFLGSLWLGHWATLGIGERTAAPHVDLRN